MPAKKTTKKPDKPKKATPAPPVWHTDHRERILRRIAELGLSFYAVATHVAARAGPASYQTAYRYLHGKYDTRSDVVWLICEAVGLELREGKPAAKG